MKKSNKKLTTKMKKSIFAILALGAVLTGCKNSDVDFPDFEYQTIYFARQTPIRTITFGEENYVDNDADKQGAFYVKAALGGVNENRAEHSVKFVIDNSLCDRIAFADGSAVKPLPDSYYTITTDRIVIPKGEVLGGFRVQLSDAFFADPDAVKTTYVLPVLLTNSADSILQGRAKDGVENPDRLIADDWSVLPQDYVLYAVKYKNAYDGCWLSKGTDKVTHLGETSTVNRNVDHWEKASLRYLRTVTLNKSKYSYSHAVATIDAEGNKSEKNIACDVILTIADNGAVTVSTETPGCTASGSGQWTSLGEKKAFADKDRDQLKLNYTYTIEYVVNDQTGEKATYKAEIDEVMCLRNRENKLEEFSYIMK